MIEAIAASSGAAAKAPLVGQPINLGAAPAGAAAQWGTQQAMLPAAQPAAMGMIAGGMPTAPHGLLGAAPGVQRMVPVAVPQPGGGSSVMLLPAYMLLGAPQPMPLQQV